jgi:hypothetical protein
MTRSIFDPATDEEIRQELAQKNPEDLIAFAWMDILFCDEVTGDDPARLAFYRRREIAREIIDYPNPPLPPFYWD